MAAGISLGLMLPLRLGIALVRFSRLNIAQDVTRNLFGGCCLRRLRPFPFVPLPIFFPFSRLFPPPQSGPSNSADILGSIKGE